MTTCTDFLYVLFYVYIYYKYKQYILGVHTYIPIYIKRHLEKQFFFICAKYN